MKSATLRFSFLLLIFSAVCVFAQDTGTISGTVRDNTGAVIPQAEVSVTSVATGAVRKTTTNSDGDYLIAGLPAGQYNITVSAAGFKRYQATNLTLRIAQ